MLKIAGVRNYLYQWDLNQKVITDDSTVDEVHFANDGHTENALIVQVKGEQTRYADIPNILLQSGENIIAYEHCNNNGEYTLRKYALEVVKRQKPDDYVYTETETKTYESLKNELDKKIDNPLSAVVGQVLTVDSVDDDGKPLKWKAAPGGGSASIDKTLTKSGYAADAKIVGDSLSQLEQNVDDKIGQTELSVAVESALTVAKESGQFDGKDGQDGQNGTDGKDGTSVTVSSVTESTVDGGTNIVTFSDGNTLNVRNGSKGDAGKKGSDGKDGTSVSVQSVVESSEDGGANVVTFSDGNSVTVHNGSKGSTGATGAAGQPGAAGQDGISPHIGENGNWWIGATDTGVKAQGDKGETGSPGAAGVAGQDGVTPHIGDNGNWWIGTTDTNVSATGGSYTLPIAAPTVLGGVKPIAKTDAMTQGVGVDESGALWTAADSGGTDISLGLTSAQVGQIVKVKAVDENGKPTQWEALNRDWEVKATYALKDMTFPAVISIPQDSDSMLIVSGTDITIDKNTKVNIILETATDEGGYATRWKFTQEMYNHGWGCGMFMELNLLDKATKKFWMQRAGWTAYKHYFTATTDILLGEENRNFYIINVDNADNINPETTTNVILYTRDAL